MSQSPPNFTEVESPCVRNCCLDLDDICLGCGRHLNEITGWQAATIQEKSEIVKRSEQRLELKKRH